MSSNEALGSVIIPNFPSCASLVTASKCVVDTLSVENKDAAFWDRELAGFGVRVYPTGEKV